MCLLRLNALAVVLFYYTVKFNVIRKCLIQMVLWLRKPKHMPHNEFTNICISFLKHFFLFWQSNNHTIAYFKKNDAIPKGPYPILKMIRKNRWLKDNFPYLSTTGDAEYEKNDISYVILNPSPRRKLRKGDLV